MLHSSTLQAKVSSGSKYRQVYLGLWAMLKCRRNLALTKIIEIIGSAHRKDFKKFFKAGCTIPNACLSSMFPNTLVQRIPHVWRVHSLPRLSSLPLASFVIEKILPPLQLQSALLAVIPCPIDSGCGKTLPSSLSCLSLALCSLG